MNNLVDRFIHKYGRLPTEFDPDYLEMLRMSKYRVVAVPDKKPGKCANCGSCKDDGRKYVDFNLEVDWFGIVYLCGFCLKDIALNVGLFRDYEERIRTAKDELLKISNLKYQGENLSSDLAKIFEEVKAYCDNVRAVGHSSTTDTDSSKSTDNPDSQSGIDSTESGITKPDSGAGRKNVPSLTDFLAD